MNPEFPVASIVRRLSAGSIDLVLKGSWIFGLGWLCSLSKSTALWLVGPLAAGVFLYDLVWHATTGKTVGKTVCRIRVVQLGGEPIGWKTSALRSTVVAARCILWAVALLIAVRNVPAAAFDGKGWPALHGKLLPFLPASERVASLLGSIWVWCNLGAMLTNKQRRALHDQLASTIVVSEAKSATAAGAARPPSSVQPA